MHPPLILKAQVEVNSRQGASKRLTTPVLTGAAPNSDENEKWTKFARRKSNNREQQRHIWRRAKAEKDLEAIRIAIKASAALTYCNKRVIVEKQGEQYKNIGGWNCGKKYCAYCSNRKRVKILNRFVDFFKGKTGTDILSKYDLGLFTVTLQHNKKGLRSTPYYAELSRHFRMAIKYGSFKKYIAGGFYNTEHEYNAKNGHHIHRHALVLIPKQYNLRENFELINEELRNQWANRTGGSFQVDLVPLGYDRTTESTPTPAILQKNIGQYMLEVTKYITKRSKKGVILFDVIKAVEQNNRAKFYGRFGILHNVKELNINLEKLEDEEPKQARELYVATPKLTTQNKTWEKLHRKTLKQKSRKNGVDNIRIVKKETAREQLQYKEVVKVEMVDMVPIADTKEAFKQFSDDIRAAHWQYQLNKWDKMMAGETVEKWKQRKIDWAKFQQNFLNSPHA